MAEKCQGQAFSPDPRPSKGPGLSRRPATKSQDTLDDPWRASAKQLLDVFSENAKATTTANLLEWRSLGDLRSSRPATDAADPAGSETLRLARLSLHLHKWRLAHCFIGSQQFCKPTSADDRNLVNRGGDFGFGVVANAALHLVEHGVSRPVL